MIKLHYFASLKERLGVSQQEIELPKEVTDVRGLVHHLITTGSATMSLLADEQQVLVAVNQEIVSRKAAIADNDEIAFFPPMTGG